MSANADNIDWGELVGLFRPGRGVMPPKLAGREAALDEMAVLLNDISKLEGQFSFLDHPVFMLFFLRQATFYRSESEVSDDYS